ncbi:TPA: DUF2235 domain-containing protein [Enterobacter chengduensis]|uniref:DUF2235 domain-containing protein n=1 Tax=Enterobacter chengduensis TaxID=2494701 RepID=A0AAW3HBR5_9ENTR|nr:DUF2235 domain-containing protein [Enterobacter chengduensis]KDF38791.1 hypothetical protein AE07_04667 [Enterobacter cloacae BWH 43]OTW34562.1 hypothetical protein CAP57_13005 [Enterobacter kobei]GJL43229.1 hypothetical protein TUM17577_44380 [Enterobacter asburiae]KJX30651.1 hypothetical protein SG71_21580 [Enterobacter chengduensis]MBN9880464.1 DUF2235 domain-containing protein [Enterobacter chengduensis]
MDIESLIAAANRAQQAEDAGLDNCSRVWHAGFFFDGIHRNIEKDTPEHRLSNIARLFRAFPDERENIPNVTYNAFYISGLGTPFNETVVEKLHTIMDSGLDSITDDITSQPGEMTKEAGMDFIKGDSWYEVLKKQGKKLLNPAEWKNLAFDTAKNAVKKVSIESTPWLRDNPTVADMLVTGVDTRITSTKLTFQEGYKEAIKKSPVPIKLISISLFGFDLGATLARKFLDSLLKDICKKEGDKYTYQSIPVDIVFTGLFDCSRRTSASNNNGVDYFISAFGGPVKGIGVLLGDKSIDQDTSLPEAVKKSLHLVAAHETRVWRCLYRTGSNPAHKEELYPGCAEDIGGGLKPDEQKPSAELSRVALHRMYREGTMAGVPFPDFQTLNESNPVVAAYFIVQDNVKNQSVLQWAKAYQSALPLSSLSTSNQNRHLDSYIDWLGRQYYQYSTECMRYEKLRGDVLASAGASAGFAGTTQEAKNVAGQYASELSVLRQHWGWLDDVKDAAIKLRNSMEHDPADRRREIAPHVYDHALWRAKRFLNYASAAYQGKPQPFPIDAAPPEMYAWFVHDLQTVEKGTGISQDFFVIRSMEMPEA